MMSMSIKLKVSSAMSITVRNRKSPKRWVRLGCYIMADMNRLTYEYCTFTVYLQPVKDGHGNDSIISQAVHHAQLNITDTAVCLDRYTEAAINKGNECSTFIVHLQPVEDGAAVDGVVGDDAEPLQIGRDQFRVGLGALAPRRLHARLQIRQARHLAVVYAPGTMA